MSRESPIGVFDSGVGGLSVLREVRRQLPYEALVYVADSAHAPYGERSNEFIEGRASNVVRALLEMRVKAILVACNTATVVAVQSLRAWCPVPVVAIEPAIKPAVQATRSGVVAVLATRQTLASTSVARLCAEHGGAARILLQPCPGWVEQVESGDLDGPRTCALLEDAIRPVLSQGADTLVLGCTHYPFLSPLIRELVGPEIAILDPAPAVARELTRRLDGAGVLSTQGGEPSIRFYTTGNVHQASQVVSTLWGEAVEVLPMKQA